MSARPDRVNFAHVAGHEGDPPGVETAEQVSGWDSPHLGLVVGLLLDEARHSGGGGLLLWRPSPSGRHGVQSEEVRHRFAFHRGAGVDGHRWLLVDESTGLRQGCDGQQHASWRPRARLLEQVPCDGRVPRLLAPAFPLQAGRFWGRPWLDDWVMLGRVTAARGLVEVTLGPRRSEQDGASGRLVVDPARGLLVLLETPAGVVELVEFDEVDLRSDDAFRPPKR